jgi:hypothetical protein
MFKRSTGLLIMLIANILLVSHSILPHQHDGGFVSLDAENHTGLSMPAETRTDDCDHKHNGQNAHQECLLQQAYLLSGSSSRFYFTLDEQANDLIGFLPIIVNPYPPVYATAFDKVSVSPPLLNSHYTFLVNRIFGLRAPPSI